MPRSRSPVPAYRLHKPSGKAVVTVYLADGSRRDLYLPGAPGRPSPAPPTPACARNCCPAG